MHTPEQARELWCPMVRIARNESITIETAAIADMVQVTEQRHIAAGCNTDALAAAASPPAAAAWQSNAPCGGGSTRRKACQSQARTAPLATSSASCAPTATAGLLRCLQTDS